MIKCERRWRSVWQISRLGFRLGFSLIILIHNVHTQTTIENHVNISLERDPA